MSLLKKGIQLANKLNESGNDNNEKKSLRSTMIEGVGKLNIPEGYIHNTAVKYFIPDEPKNLPGCLNQILGQILGKKAEVKLVSDREFDVFKENKISDLTDKGMSKLSISPSNLIKKSDVIYGPYWYEIPEGYALEDLEIVKKGGDGKFRYIFFSVAILYYTEKQLLIYTAKYNLALEEILKSTTEEYFYKDIIGVSADEESFTLKTTGGNAIEIEFQKPAYRKYKIDSSDAEDAVTNIRKILREVKS
jgi:hypothetical protein